uniref:Uncharacterized protein n=1 Tax=Knipowitschia caucasica TaxID=637954 RepID=A0AAV2MLN7_KNICA
MRDFDGDCVSNDIVSQISTEQLKSVALRYWKQALQMTKPKKVLAEMLLEIIDTLSNNILDLLSQPECPLVSQEDISRALEPCLTDIFDFLLSTSHDACAPLFKALSAVVCSSVNAGQSHSEIQPKTSYVPPKEHLVKMMHLIKPLLRFARDQECRKHYSEPLPDVAQQTNAVRHHSTDFSTRGPQVSEESECSDSENETRSTEMKVSSDTRKVTPPMASKNTIIQIQYIAEEAATEMLLKGQESKSKELLRPLCKDQEAASQVEIQWNDQHWSYLLQEVCFRVLATSEENNIEQLFQLLLKYVEQHKSECIVRVKPDLHHIREAANAIHQAVIANLGEWMLFTIMVEPEFSAATITDCILKRVSMPQQIGFIQERASLESFDETNTSLKSETAHKTPDMVYGAWLDYKARKKAPSPEEYIPAEQRAATQDHEDFMWSNSDWSNLVFELSALVFGTRNPHKLAECSMLLFGHVQTFKDRCNVRMKPDEHNIEDVANQIYKDLRQIYPKKALRLIAFSDPHVITAGIPKQLERIPKKRTLGTVLRSVCRAIFRRC